MFWEKNCEPQVKKQETVDLFFFFAAGLSV